MEFNLIFDFSTLSAIAASIMILEELIDRIWNLDGVNSQIRTFVIGILLGLFGALLKLGIFADPTYQPFYIYGPIIGIYATLFANFAFLTPLAKKILEFLKIRVPKE